MPKKSSKPKTTADEILTIQENYLPTEIAHVFKKYYESFLSEGFSVEQSFKLTQQVLDFYLHPK